MANYFSDNNLIQHPVSIYVLVTGVQIFLFVYGSCLWFMFMVHVRVICAMRK
jgi:membrane glycosyltransferase